LFQTDISRSKVPLSAAVHPNDVSFSKWRVSFAAKAALTFSGPRANPQRGFCA
jgi:hypothetical protein